MKSFEKEIIENADVAYLVKHAEVFNKIYTSDFDAADSMLDELFHIVHHKNTSNHNYFLLKTLNVSQFVMLLSLLYC